MSLPELTVRRIRPGDSAFARAKRWEYEVFGRENGYTCPADDAAGEMTHYRRWESSSEFYLGFAGSAAEPAVVLRALRADTALGLNSFSTLADLGDGLDPPWARRFAATAPETVAELATQAVRRAHRGAGVMEQVWARFADELTAEGVRYLTVALVVPLFDWYRMVFGTAIDRIGPLLPDYIGADSIPAVIDLHRLLPTIPPTVKATQ
ncbi:hypothetical protein NDR87_00380 [Nocardia sp. CDC159]|uniref:Uncharacterized protein n=1 Tax=Nocardia pulmonis TaxID=2951408 RepID=A0A9X2E3R3_9NOCA|nr:MULTISPECIES: hypothetical protein [Nocardia]MCM6772533.1 hypothetical protein [Nocardia pulmonis]MCM6784809.1 hypothetical protein [Nocardia sp. CDC159]